MVIDKADNAAKCCNWLIIEWCGGCIIAGVREQKARGRQSDRV